MTKLRECPFCGGEAILNSGEDVECSECEIYMVHKSGEPTDDVLLEEWNRRTPAPMTSVIEWTRYDGTPETLPEYYRSVLLYRFDSVDEGDVRVAHKVEDANYWDSDDLDVPRVTIVIGDTWAYPVKPPDA